MSDLAISTVEPTVRGRHLPGLDGLRALAVLAVVAFHLNLSIARGGFLGVDLFFVLSGFLITSLLAEERLVTGVSSLAGFWGRRAKRLLPALFCMLIVVAAYVAIVGHFRLFGGALIDLSEMRGNGVASIYYVANWQLLYAHQSYFAQFLAPSPYEHTWTLSIEEQFYWLWPLVIVGLFAWATRRWRQIGTGIVIVGIAASAVYMALVAAQVGGTAQAYFNTFTRAFDLLIGAAVALLLAGGRRPSTRATRVIEASAIPAAILLAAFWVAAGTPTGAPRQLMYQGGFLLCGLLAALVISAVALAPRSLAARALAWRPLAAIGVVSYGIYLWHWPVIVLIGPAQTGMGRWSTDLLRLALIAVLTVASYRLLERPLRRHRWTLRQALIAAPLAFAITTVLVVVLTSGSLARPPSSGKVVTSPVLGVGPLKSIPGAGGLEGQVPIKLFRNVDAAHPLRVLLIGDSLIQEASSGLEAAFSSTGDIVTKSAAWPGWGLTATSQRPFYQLGLFQLGFHPDVLVGSWGWDNAFAASDPVGYARKIEHLVTEMTGPGRAAGVLLLTQPSSGAPPPSFDTTFHSNFSSQAHLAAWSAVVRRVEHDMPGKLMLAPVADSVLLPGGHYTTWLPPGDRPKAPYAAWVRVRKEDGFHLCQNGTVRYATALLTDLQQLFGVGPSTSAWWSKAWIHDRNYNLPTAGATCPVDGPPPGTSVLHPAPPST